MKNRITVNVAGQELHLLVDESEEYMYKVASIADQKIRSIIEATRISASQAATLACLNIVDDLLKANELTEHMRAQLKDYIEESSKSKMEINELRRELIRLKNAGVE
jgi:cell division protein ZapA (FtsZ GTPase activity inhibitor)